MNIHKSAEDYLETILIIKERRGLVRSIDVVNELGFSKPSISIAMKRLRESGYVEMDAEGYLTLTESGNAIAKRIYTRHRVLTQLLMQIGVSESVAAEDACKIEHDLSDESFRKIRQHLKILKNMPTK